jgi:hypothetical protein
LRYLHKKHGGQEVKKMLFLYIHTHPVEKCLAGKPEEAAKIFSQVQDAIKKTNVKIIASYMAPHEHTLYSIFEANDLAGVEMALAPMTSWGNARMIPIMSTEQLPTS